MERLIITCDDCGLSEGINQATLDLYQQDLPVVASIMPNMPAADHAFTLFADYPELEVGAHLNVSDGFPLSKIGSPSALTRADGRFHPPVWSVIRNYVPTPGYLELFEAEMRAQLDVFAQHGRKIGHITTHRHFHASPWLRKVIVKLAREYDVSWLRAYRLTAMVMPGNIFHKHDSEEQEHLPLFVPDHLIGIREWMPRDPEPMLDVLLKFEGVAEFILHPCTPDDPTFPAGVDYPPAERHEEVAYLVNAIDLFRAKLDAAAKLLHAR